MIHFNLAAQFPKQVPNQQGDMMNRKWFLSICVLALMPFVMLAEAGDGRTGEAVVAALTGQVEARYFIGPVHEGRTERAPVFRGAAVGERTQVMTGRNGHCCLVFTPGVLMHLAPETSIVVEEVRLTAPGLPRSEDDLIRRVVVRVERGRVYVNGGVPSPTLQLALITDAGRIEADGGQFSVASSNGEWSILSEENDVILAPANGTRVTVPSGQAGIMTASRARLEPSWDEASHLFQLCRGVFRDVEPFFHTTRGYDRNALGQFLGAGGPPIYLGAQGLIADVSPSFRPTAAATAAPEVPPVAGPGADQRWSQDQIWRWWNDIGVIRGVNYIPSTAVNSTEMWMEETFDLDTMDEELAAAQGMGYTSVRVVLQQAVWEADPEGFMDRVAKFVDLADSHGLQVVPVLFDDLNRAGTDPSVGPQPEPLPETHNSRWTPGPGPAAVTDLSRWPALEEYVSDVVGRFRRDRRILYWCIYNTAGNDGLWEQSLPLMDQSIDWVRDVNPRQPIAVPAWRDFGSPMSARKFERSDLVVFHTFENAEVVKGQLQMMQRFNRPIVVSDWLMRQRGNTFEEILPIFATYGVGWFNRGLVQGRTQMWIQDEVNRDPERPEVWQHDMLTPDGEPFNEAEVELIRSFRYTGGR